MKGLFYYELILQKNKIIIGGLYLMLWTFSGIYLTKTPFNRDIMGILFLIEIILSIIISNKRHIKNELLLTMPFTVKKIVYSKILFSILVYFISKITVLFIMMANNVDTYSFIQLLLLTPITWVVYLGILPFQLESENDSIGLGVTMFLILIILFLWIPLASGYYTILSIILLTIVTIWFCLYKIKKSIKVLQSNNYW